MFTGNSNFQKMPVLFTSHGNPFDIPKSREEHPFWEALYDLGVSLRNSTPITAILVISAHWCTRGTFVNSGEKQKQIFDYYGFPDEYYKALYHANGSPETAREVKKLIMDVTETAEWGLDHGAWPMLMHLVPDADIPVFQLSINYHAAPQYHFDLGKKLQPLRTRGVLIIGSGALIHNLAIAGEKMSRNDLTPAGWEAEFDAWIAEQLDTMNIGAILDYKNSHPLGKLAAPTPDHFVPVLYTLGLMDDNDRLRYFYDAPVTFPAFGERSFVVYSK